jgi:hypothetical protein
MTIERQEFYSAVPVFDSFAEVMEPSRYRAIPDDWSLGYSDVVGSTKAISEGRYKAINMVGAGSIAAVANALSRRPFPFAFGGDGASFAVAASDTIRAAEALAAMAVFAREELQLELRVAMAPMTAIRAAGFDVRVGRFAANEHCSYAMFAGGGLAWLEAEAKRGAFALPPAPEGARPDLSDLSCRFTIAPAARGLILSMIVVPRGDDPRFSELVRQIVAMAARAADSGRPVTLATLGTPWPAEGIALETAASAAPGRSRLMRRAALASQFLLGVALRATRVKVGEFDAAVYVGDVAANADFRKYADGLRMTLDCSPAFADTIEARLAGAGDFADWGTFRQDNALMTCYTPSITDRGHVHFVDGAGGGYAMAAQSMKGRAASSPKGV